MKKNFKYILIFIFIVCLLIPISCINIFAVTYSAYYSTFYTQSYSDGYETRIYFYDIESISYNNNIVTNDYGVLSIRLYSYNNKTGNDFIIVGIEKRDNNLSIKDTYYIYNTYVVQNFNLPYDFIINYYSNNYFNIKNDKNGNYYDRNGYGNKLLRDTNYSCNLYNNQYIYIFNDIVVANTDQYVTCNLYFNLIINSISFDKTYNLSFYNNDILYDSITISGASASGYAPFEEISQIKYGNTIVYDNSTWSSGYSSTLRYNQNMSNPNITQLNIDCNNIVTFYTQYYTATQSYSKEYILGTFYNNSSGEHSYSKITIYGTIAVGTTSPFLTITDIKFDNVTAYGGGNWNISNGGYSTTLYTMSNSPLNLTTLNNDCNCIFTFTNLFINENIYSIGEFFIGDDTNNLYNTISINGTLNNNNVFSSINTIKYNSTIVYQNGSWISGYSPNLKYFGFSDIDITQLNTDTNIIVHFTKTQVDVVNPTLQQNLLGGIDVLLLPVTSLIEQGNNNIVIAMVLMFLVVNFAVTIVFIFIKIKQK